MAAEHADVVIVGAGAAGLATAVFCRERARDLRVVCLDGAARVGAKILVSGGSRCNVTNRTVDEHDFWGGSARSIRRVLHAFPAERTAAFFTGLGVSLHEEDDGKLFPDTNRARSVLDALLREADRTGVELMTRRRVIDVRRETTGLEVETQAGDRYTARAVVLATGGRSLPKTGSDGAGYGLAARLGHGYVETTPALAPLLLDGGMQHGLEGVSLPAAVTVRPSGGAPVRLHGPLLWTHFGISGPVALNASRHWHRAQLTHQGARVSLNLFPGDSPEHVDSWLQNQLPARPRAHVATVLARRLPGAVADAWVRTAGIDAVTTCAHLTRDARRRLVRALTDAELSVRGSRGYNFAEVTAGGIPLDEIDPATMGSRVCPSLYLVGEILDVDGRLGGFNFQWAWSSAWVAAQALARLRSPAPQR